MLIEEVHRQQFDTEAVPAVLKEPSAALIHHAARSLSLKITARVDT